MKADSLTPGVFRVRHPEREQPFNLSIVRDSTWAFLAVAGYEDGQKPPRHGKHLLLSPLVRQWVEELQPV